MANVSIDATGQLRSDITSRDVVPITDFGPVLDGSALESLPGPCVPVPQPGENLSLVSSSCLNTPSLRNLLYFNSNTQTLVSTGTAQRQQVVGYKSVTIVGRAPLRVFFDFNNLSNEFYGAGVAIVQSDTPFPQSSNASDIIEWFDRSATRRLRDTRSDGVEPINNGRQVGRFGVDAWSTGEELLNGAVQSLMGITAIDLQTENFFAVGTQITQPPLLDFPVASLPIYPLSANLRTRGYGFIQTQADCSRGKFITVFVIADLNPPLLSDNPVFWQAVVDHEAEFTGSSNELSSCNEADQTAPSRAYQQGAILTEWVGQNTYGYFGQVNGAGETAPSDDDQFNDVPTAPSDRYVDNIHYPYEMPNPNLYVAPAGLASGYNQDPLRAADIAPGVTKLAARYIQDLRGRFNFGGSYRTVEIKGYFRAPVSGDYEFYGAARDGLWMWLSSRGVSDKQRIGVADDQAEYFVQDGFDPGATRGYSRQNYVLRVGALTAGTENRVESNGIKVTLEEGKYYFVRILSGCDSTAGFFSVRYEASSSNSTQSFTGDLIFQGKQCPGDNPPISANPDSSAIGSGSGGIALPGPGPGGFGGDGLYQNFLFSGPYIGGVGATANYPWWWQWAPVGPRRGTVTIRDLPDAD